MDAELVVKRAGLLNFAQRNLLTLGLRAFEMHLREADAWLHGREERGILYQWCHALSISSRPRGHSLLNLSCGSACATARA